MTGMAEAVRSRVMTLPCGLALRQFATNSSVRLREIEASPIGLESM